MSGPRAGYITFICRRCGGLCCSSAGLWQRQDRCRLRSQRYRTSFNGTINTIFTFPLDRSVEANFSDIFQLNGNIIKEHGYDFPVCNRCLIFYSLCAERVCDFFKMETALLTVTSFDLEKIKKKIDKNLDQVEVIKLVKSAPLDARHIPSDSEPFYRGPNYLVSPKKENMYKKIDTSNIAVGSLLVFSMFPISACRHYGTINGFRLGTLTPDAVPYEEIDQGFFFLCQLFIVLGKQTRANTKSIMLNSEINIKLPGEAFTPFSSSLLKGGRKKIQRFNEYICYLFELFKQLFFFFNGQPNIPNIVNTNNRTINEVSYVYDPKNPDKWTLAMKYTLINFKSVQMQSLLKGAMEYL